MTLRTSPKKELEDGEAHKQFGRDGSAAFLSEVHAKGRVQGSRAAILNGINNRYSRREAESGSRIGYTDIGFEC